MRDRNAPKKRANMREAAKANPIQGGHDIYSNTTLPYGVSSGSYSRASSEATGSPGSPSSIVSGRQADPRRLLDLYYK